MTSGWLGSLYVALRTLEAQNWYKSFAGWLFHLATARSVEAGYFTCLEEKKIASSCQTFDQLKYDHLSVFTYFIISTFFYLLIWKLFEPKVGGSFWERFIRSLARKAGSDKDEYEAPVLMYMMMLISIGTLLLGAATFFFDAMRVPLLLFLLVSSFLYWAYGIDNFYKLRSVTTSDGNSIPLKAIKVPSAIKVLNKRPLPTGIGQQGKTLVVVCAAGGGFRQQVGQLRF